MQLKTLIAVQCQKPENRMRDTYVQAMLNMPNLMDIMKMKVIYISDLNVHRIHFNFHVIKRYQIFGKHSEKREIEITQTIVSP